MDTGSKSDALLNEASRLAVQVYGAEAQVAYKGDEAHRQWWVKGKTGGQILAAETLRDLVNELISKSSKATVQAVSNGEITGPEADKILGHSHGYATKLFREGKIVGRVEKGQGFAGRVVKLERASVEAWKESHPHVTPRGNAKQELPVLPSATKRHKLTSHQVAAILGCQPTTVSTLVRRRGLKATQIQGKGGLAFRFTLSDVMDWKRHNTLRQPVGGWKVKNKKEAKPVKLTLGHSKGEAVKGLTLPNDLKLRLEKILTKYGEPPFNLTAESVVVEAVRRELTRLEG